MYKIKMQKYKYVDKIRKSRIYVKLESKNNKKLLVRVFLYILLIDLAFVFLLPFFFMMISSVKTDADFNDITVKWIPTAISFDGYKAATVLLDFWRRIINSSILTILATAGHILSCSMAGYAFARYEFKGKNILFVIVLITFIVPIQAIIIPSYVINVRIFRFQNTFWPMVIPSFLGLGLKGGLYIYLFRQFFISFPKSMEEAARIDGCGFFKTLLKIVMPSSRTVIMVVGVLSMVWQWNDYFEPDIYLRKDALKTLTQRLPFLYDAVQTIISADDFYKLRDEVGIYIQQIAIKYPDIEFTEAILTAGTFITILPILIAYIFLQRKFIEGIEHTGYKE